MGYLRHLEGWLAPPYPGKPGPLPYIGWETALARRRGDSEDQLPSSLGDWLHAYRTVIGDILPLRTSNRYWAFVWYTFAFLSSSSLFLAYRSAVPFCITTDAACYFEILELAMPTAAFVVSALYNLYMVGDLATGRRSYEHHYRKWRSVLEQVGSGGGSASGTAEGDATRRDSSNLRGLEAATAIGNVD